MRLWMPQHQTEMPGTNSLCELQNAANSVCVCESRKVESSRSPVENNPEPWRKWVFLKREIQTVPTLELEGWNRWHLFKTGTRPWPAAAVDGGLPREHQPTVHVHALTCSVFSSATWKNKVENFWWLKKRERETSYFRVTFTAKKIIKVILLFTCSYFQKDNPLLSEKEWGVKDYTAGEMYLEVLLCVRQLKRQDFNFFVLFCFFCLKAI